MSEIQYIVTDVTYAELVALIGTSGLEEGCYYRITDFATVHYMIDGYDVFLDSESNPEINIGTTEPLTVLALSANTISSKVKSELYPDDIILYDWNPDNWKFDLAFSAWDETVLTGFKGVITDRHATFNNVKCGYDCRNVLLRRWEADELLDNNFIFPTSTGYYAWNLDLKSPLSYQDFKTFNCPAGDASFENCVKNVHIMPLHDNVNEGIAGMSIINNNVFHVEEGYQSLYNVTIGFNSHLNTFIGYITDAIIKNNLWGNLIIESGYLEISTLLWDCSLSHVWNCEFKGNNDLLIIGDYTVNTIFENGVSFFTIPAKTQGNGCKNNIFREGVDGNGSPYNSQMDFTSATHIFAAYNCEIFMRADGTRKLKYCNDNDEIVVVNANA